MGQKVGQLIQQIKTDTGIARTKGRQSHGQNRARLIRGKDIAQATPVKTTKMQGQFADQFRRNPARYRIAISGGYTVYVALFAQFLIQKVRALLDAGAKIAVGG